MPAVTARPNVDRPHAPYHDSPTTNGTVERIAEQAEKNLRDSPYLVLRNVLCDFDGHVLTLRGRLPSFHMKQVAQTIVGNLEAVQRVDNRIEVHSCH
ncbi:MAG: BON domain-containing protein [Pirellulaceae bacterium]|nr:BON domain-containing protein [Planctomycetales bacterium]MCA9225442.1 BON domain-containing protein [Planctomycetales bacterium]